MNQMNQPQNDEIDFFELSQTLWDGKWIISTFVAIAIFLGGCLLLFQDTVYESKIRYSIDTLPPFYGTTKASADFQKKFYSKNIFEDWKKNNSKGSLVFENFSNEEIVDGFMLSKKEGRKQAT